MIRPYLFHNPIHCILFFNCISFSFYPTYFRYAKPDESVDMINHYIDDMDDEQEAKLRTLISKPDHSITTAMIEKLCIEYDTIDEILRCLDEEMKGNE